MRELTDDEIVKLYEESYLESGLDEWEFDPVYFARAVIKASQEVSKPETNWLETVNNDEARYNAAMGRSGVRWAGD